MERPERRIVLAGESPVRVSAGAPGGRLRSRGEIRAARRSVKSLCKRGGQTNGLQQSVNAIASTNYQPKGVWESRASHVTAKATDSVLDRNECWIRPGVSGGGTTGKNNAEQERPYLAAKKNPGPDALCETAGRSVGSVVFVSATIVYSIVGDVHAPKHFAPTHMHDRHTIYDPAWALS